MENKEFEFKGGSMNGFAMLVIDVVLVCALMATVIYGILEENGWYALLALVLFVVFIFCTKGFAKLEPNEGKVLTFFGRYVGTFRKTGFYWINPLMSAKNVSLRASNFNAEPIKVNDKVGNPIMIGIVLVWRVRDTYKAFFDINGGGNMQGFERFVAVQCDSALRQVTGMYAYDNDGDDSHEVTLRSGSDEVNEVLRQKINERLAMAGIEAVEARINYLAYAPEIAAVMLRRQQAAAIITAREKIVEGAVSMVKMALDRLSADGIVELDEEKKAAMVSNLLVVLCADEPAQPVINSGTLNH